MFRRKPLAAGLLALAALTGGNAFAAKDVVIALHIPAETLDPYSTNTTLTTAVTKSFYEGLFEFDKDLKIRPALAESYEVSPDGIVYTFKLRQGVKFHDGTDFNAEAVKFVLDRVTNPENKLPRANQFRPISKVDVVDAHTVRITLKEPFSPFLNALAHGSAAMISPTALKKWGNKDIAFHPVGTGPFEFVEWKQTDFVKVKKFDGYWKKGYPKVDSITWKPVPENGTRMAMLQTGEAHFVSSVPAETATALKNNPKLNLTAADSIIVRYISMNTMQKPFDDIRVRQAVNYAINRDALVKVAFGGFATPTDAIVPHGIKFSHKTGPWAYDVKKARELLKEAGYPNGFEATMWGAYNDSTTQKALQFIQQQLQQVGIKLTVQALEIGQRVEWVQSAPDPATARVRMYYAGWSSSTGDADWALRPLLASESFPPKLNNTAYYKNDVVDSSISKALKSTDDKELASLYKTAQEQIWKDAPWAPLVVQQNVYAQSKNLTGIFMQPDGNINSTEISLSE
ncbi:glutathione ABC transporter substrate-binding protein GsiB [Pigmentiphaga aceris]|uniref:Glutathione-binding protein GsiB n=2 Tax=Pigmentiphaga aceris TaxID=1940612 RepID=A0A5C0B456_9BURK|nr:glutathione ABC transporter substrate-binding protein GsiB [Pigmentiphaga aceris]